MRQRSERQNAKSERVSKVGVQSHGSIGPGAANVLYISLTQMLHAHDCM